MNQLITDIFGDPYITLNCAGGECLHYSQVPGYAVSNIGPSCDPVHVLIEFLKLDSPLRNQTIHYGWP